VTTERLQERTTRRCFWGEGGKGKGLVVQPPDSKLRDQDLQWLFKMSDGGWDDRKGKATKETINKTEDGETEVMSKDDNTGGSEVHTKRL